MACRRLLRLKGGVIPEFFEVGLVDWRRITCWGRPQLCPPLNITPPLSAKGEARSWGAHSPAGNISGKPRVGGAKSNS